MVPILKRTLPKLKNMIDINYKDHDIETGVHGGGPSETLNDELDKSQNGNNQTSNNSLVINYQPTSPGSLLSVEASTTTFPVQPPTNKSEDKSCLESCKFVTFCLFYLGIVGIVLGLVGAIVSYLVFGIKFLIKDYPTSEDCNSDVGDFVLVSLILSFILGGGQVNNNKGDDPGVKLCVNIFLSFFWLGWGIWGFVITQEDDCEDLDNTNLVRYSHVISIYFMTMGSLIIIICLLFTLVIACKKN